MKITLSHSGKQHSYHVARSLHQLGYLDVFFTSSYITQPWLQQWLLQRGDTFWTRRFLPGLHSPQVRASWGFELKEVALRKVYGKRAITQNAVYRRDEEFDAYVGRMLKNRPSQVFWGFQGSCHISLQAAQGLGRFSICELATAHVVASKKILGEEQKLHPEWADSLDNLVFPAQYEKRLVEEPHLAHLALAASQFTRHTLLADGVPDSKIGLLPLGFDLDHVPYTERLQDNLENRPLRLLYAGTITQRKGVKYLLEAMKAFDKKDVELTMIGGVQGSGQAFRSYAGLYSHQPAIAQQQLFQLYGQYDALVLPTIFEGFGLVIVEAMAAGLPVITTAHSMGPEVIEQGKNGYLVPIRDTQALQAAIGAMRQLDTASYLAMRRHARHSVLAFSWQAYQNNLATFILNLKQNAGL